MAAELKTPGGLIVPRSVLETKADRTQAQTVRAMGARWSETTRFREYSQYLQAIRIPWVHRCVMTIVQTFANQVWFLKNGDTNIDSPTNPFLQLMQRPNPHQTLYRFLEMFAMFMELLGEAFITKEAVDADGRPRELYLPNPAYMTVVPDPVNFVKGYIFQAGGMGPKIWYEPDEVIHIKMPNPSNPFRGFGPVEACADLLDIVSKITGFELSYYGSGGRIVGVLETEFEVSDDDFEKVKADWRAFSADDQQRMKTAILQNGLKYTPIAEGMKNIDMTSINNEKRDTILGNWGVPKTKLGITEGAAEQMGEADQTFHSETMAPKFERWEQDIQPLIDLFDADWRWAFQRKNFEDDTTKLTNSQKMAMTYSFSVDDIRAYNDQNPLPNGSGQIIWAPTQMTPYKVTDLADVADNNMEISDQDAEPPPDPPAPIISPPGGFGGPGVAHLPGQTAQAGTAPAKPTNGAAPQGAGPGAGPKPAAVKDFKSVDDLIEMAAIEGLDDGTRQQLITDAARQQMLAAGVANRLYRTPKSFRGPGLKAINPQRASTTMPATALYLRQRLKTFMDNAGQNNDRLKKAFRLQRRAVLKALPDLLKAAASTPLDKRAALIERRLNEILSAHTDDLKAAVAPIHVAGLVNGFQSGAHVLPPAHGAVLRRRVPQKSVSVESKSADWQQYVEDWKLVDPAFNRQFDLLAAKAAANLSEMSVAEMTKTIQEGVRRSYSEAQVVGGNADEDFDGLQGTIDTLEVRAEAVVRVEGREAFNAGVAEALNLKLALTTTTQSEGKSYGSLEKAIAALVGTKEPTAVTVNLPEGMVNVTVQPAELRAPDVIVQSAIPDVIVQPADVKSPDVVNNVTVQPAEVKSPDVHVKAPAVTFSPTIQPATVKAPDVRVTNEVKTPDVKVVNEIPKVPKGRKSVKVKYDEKTEEWTASESEE